MMNNYESVFIVNPSVEEDKVKALIQKFSDLINSDGRVTKISSLLFDEASEVLEEKENIKLHKRGPACVGLLAEL